MSKTWAQSYWHSVPIMRRRIEKLARHTKPGRVLDLGCNDGQLSQAIFEQGGREVVGVDIVQEHINKARMDFCVGVPDGAGPTFVLADGVKLPFPDNHFDTVVMAELLEHLGKNQGAVLAEAHRVLKPEGNLVWSLPIGDYWLGELTHQWALHATVISHHSVEGKDDCTEQELEKHIIVVEWTRRRWLTDPAPSVPVEAVA